MATRKAKDPQTMSAAAINAELDANDKRDSVLIDEMIAAGRGNERPTDWQHKTDPLSTRINALRERRAELLFEVRRRAGPGMYRLPKGFGPMKNNPSSINARIDAMNRKANPAPTRLVQRKANPRINKYAPSHRVESSIDKKEWVHYGDFLGKAKAIEIAKLLHESHPNLHIRVVTIK